MNRNPHPSCQATFKNHCHWPQCDCAVETKEELEGKCHALWLLNGGQTEEWNGESCNCSFTHGQVNCKLNPF